jgi:hypothetical protein
MSPRTNQYTEEALPTCGDYGGVAYGGLPCGNEAGWGTDNIRTGVCKKHTPERLAEIAEMKVNFLEAYRGLETGGPITKLMAARSVGVGTGAIYRWQQEDPDFDDAVKKLQVEIDNIRTTMVEESMFDRIVAGDASAAECIFWLKNRAPDRWRDRKDVSVGIAAFVGSLPANVLQAIVTAGSAEEIEAALSQFPDAPKLLPGG